MPATDLNLLIEAARSAGEISTSFTGKTALRWDKGGDEGPVTEADMAVNSMLQEYLLTARPGYGWLSEESEDTLERLAQERVFIVDPIDGTRSFVEGSKTWAHAMAVVENGEVTAGVVYLPMLDKLYSAARGQGAFLNGEPLRVQDMDDLGRASILAARPVMSGVNWENGQTPSFHRAYRPSLAYRMALVGEGRFHGMLTLRPCWEWDIAAGDLIIREAGGHATDKAGNRLKFNNRVPKQNGLIGGTTGVHKELARNLSEKTTNFG